MSRIDEISQRIAVIEHETAIAKSKVVEELIELSREVIFEALKLDMGMFAFKKELHRLCEASVSGTQPRMVVSVSDLRRLLETQ